jgi:hypothetical protein
VTNKKEKKETKDGLRCEDEEGITIMMIDKPRGFAIMVRMTLIRIN